MTRTNIDTIDNQKLNSNHNNKETKTDTVRSKLYLMFDINSSKIISVGILESCAKTL